MAELPTMTEVEDAILQVFAHHGVRPGEMLMQQSLYILFNGNRYRAAELNQALDSLVDKEEIDVKPGRRGLFLTEKGFRRIRGAKEADAPPSSVDFGQGNTFHFSGPNARLNVGSVDNSSNTVTIWNALFDKMVAELEGLPEEPAKAKAIEAAKDLKAHQGKPTIKEKLRSFLSAASDSATVFETLGPYVSDLMDLLP